MRSFEPDQPRRSERIRNQTMGNGEPEQQQLRRSQRSRSSESSSLVVDPDPTPIKRMKKIKENPNERIYFSFATRSFTKLGVPYMDVIPRGKYVWLTKDIAVDPYKVRYIDAVVREREQIVIPIQWTVRPDIESFYVLDYPLTKTQYDQISLTVDPTFKRSPRYIQKGDSYYLVHRISQPALITSLDAGGLGLITQDGGPLQPTGIGAVCYFLFGTLARAFPDQELPCVYAQYAYHHPDTHRLESALNILLPDLVTVVHLIPPYFREGIRKYVPEYRMYITKIRNWRIRATSMFPSIRQYRRAGFTPPLESLLLLWCTYSDIKGGSLFFKTFEYDVSIPNVDTVQTSFAIYAQDIKRMNGREQQTRRIPQLNKQNQIPWKWDDLQSIVYSLLPSKVLIQAIDDITFETEDFNVKHQLYTEDSVYNVHDLSQTSWLDFRHTYDMHGRWVNANEPDVEYPFTTRDNYNDIRPRMLAISLNWSLEVAFRWDYTPPGPNVPPPVDPADIPVSLDDYLELTVTRTTYDAAVLERHFHHPTDSDDDEDWEWDTPEHQVSIRRQKQDARYEHYKAYYQRWADRAEQHLVQTYLTTRLQEKDEIDYKRSQSERWDDWVPDPLISRSSSDEEQKMEITGMLGRIRLRGEDSDDDEEDEKKVSEFHPLTRRRLDPVTILPPRHDLLRLMDARGPLANVLSYGTDRDKLGLISSTKGLWTEPSLPRLVNLNKKVFLMYDATKKRFIVCDPTNRTRVYPVSERMVQLLTNVEWIDTDDDRFRLFALAQRNVRILRIQWKLEHIVPGIFPMQLTTLSLSLYPGQILRSGVLPPTLTMLHLNHFDKYGPGVIEAGALPESLIGLKMTGKKLRYAYQLTRDMFPSRLTHLALHFKKLGRCGPGILPESLTHLIIEQKQDPDFESGFFPPNLIYLQIKTNDNCVFPPGVFPTSLRYLKFYGSGIMPISRNVLPDGLVYLDMGGKNDSNFESNALPASLARLSYGDRPWALGLEPPTWNWRLPLLPDPPLTRVVLGWQFNQVIPIGMLPSTITHLAFGNQDPCVSQYNELFEIGALPDHLVDLQLSDEYDQPIVPGVLPSSLTHLTFGEKYDQPLEAGSLPKNLQHLTFGHEYNQPIDNVLPVLSSLTHLTFGGEYNQVLPHTLFTRTTLTHLTFGNDFNHLIEEGVLPRSLTHLTFGDNYHIPIRPGVLPRGLTHLSLGTYYRFKIVAGVLPDGLTYLRIGPRYNQLIMDIGPEHARVVPDFSVIPRTVTHLMIGHDFQGITDSYMLAYGCVFPPWITHLTLGTNIRPRMFSHALPEGLTHFSVLRARGETMIRDDIPNSTTHLETGENPERVIIPQNYAFTHLTLRRLVPLTFQWRALYHITIRTDQPDGPDFEDGINPQHVQLGNLSPSITHLRVSWTNELLLPSKSESSPPLQPSIQHLEIYEHNDWQIKVFWPIPIPLTDSVFNQDQNDDDDNDEQPVENRPLFTERRFFTELYDSSLQTIAFFEHYDSTTAMTTHIVRRDHQQHAAYLDPPIPCLQQQQAQGEWKDSDDSDDEKKMDITGMLGRIRLRGEDSDDDEKDEKQIVTNTRRRLNPVTLPPLRPNLLQLLDAKGPLANVLSYGTDQDKLGLISINKEFGAVPSWHKMLNIHRTVDLKYDAVRGRFFTESGPNFDSLFSPRYKYPVPHKMVQSLTRVMWIDSYDDHNYQMFLQTQRNVIHLHVPYGLRDLTPGILPRQLTFLELRALDGQVLVPGVLPSTLIRLELDMAKYKASARIEVGAIPESVIQLKLRTTTALSSSMFPTHLTHLELDLCSIYICRPGMLPDSITHLYLYAYDVRFEPGFFPPNLIYLDVQARGNFDLPPRDIFPDSLRYLRLGEHIDITQGLLPPGLLVLHLPFQYGGVIESGALPASLTRLTFGEDQWGSAWQYTDPVPDYPITPFRLPVHPDHPMTHLILPDNDNVIPIGMIPPTVTHLQFGQSYNNMIEPGALPNGLLDLTLGYNFNQPIDIRALPATLTHLTFGYDFNETLTPGVFPEGLTHLTFGARFHQVIERGILPSTLTHLSFTFSPGTYTYDHMLRRDMFPDGLTHLSLGANYRYPIQAGVLPNGLTYLQVGSDYHRNIPDISVIPRTVTHLTIGDKYGINNEIVGNNLNLAVLPPWITHLTIGCLFRGQISKDVLPSGLTHLSILKSTSGTMPIVRRDTLPDSVTHLELGYKCGKLETPAPLGLTHLLLSSAYNLSELNEYGSVYHLTITWHHRGDMMIDRVPENITHLRVPWILHLNTSHRSNRSKPSTIQHLEFYARDDWQTRFREPVPSTLDTRDDPYSRATTLLRKDFFFADLYHSSLQTISFFKDATSTAAIQTHVVRRDPYQTRVYLDPPIPGLPQPQEQEPEQEEWKDGENNDDEEEEEENKMDITGMLGRIRPRDEDDDDEKKSVSRRRIDLIPVEFPNERIYFSFATRSFTQNGQPYVNKILPGTYVWLTDNIRVNPYNTRYIKTGSGQAGLTSRPETHVNAESENLYVLDRSLDLNEYQEICQTIDPAFGRPPRYIQKGKYYYLVHRMFQPALIVYGDKRVTRVATNQNVEHGTVGYFLFGTLARASPDQDLPCIYAQDRRINKGTGRKEFALNVLSADLRTVMHIIPPFLRVGMRQYVPEYRMYISTVNATGLIRATTEIPASRRPAGWVPLELLLRHWCSARRLKQGASFFSTYPYTVRIPNVDTVQTLFSRIKDDVRNMNQADRESARVPRLNRKNDTSWPLVELDEMVNMYSDSKDIIQGLDDIVFETEDFNPKHQLFYEDRVYNEHDPQDIDWLTQPHHEYTIEGEWVDTPETSRFPAEDYSPAMRARMLAISSKWTLQVTITWDTNSVDFSLEEYLDATVLDCTYKVAQVERHFIHPTDSDDEGDWEWTTHEAFTSLYRHKKELHYKHYKAFYQRWVDRAEENITRFYRERVTEEKERIDYECRQLERPYTRPRPRLGPALKSDGTVNDLYYKLLDKKTPLAAIMSYGTDQDNAKLISSIKGLGTDTSLPQLASFNKQVELLYDATKKKFIVRRLNPTYGLYPISERMVQLLTNVDWVDTNDKHFRLFALAQRNVRILKLTRGLPRLNPYVLPMQLTTLFLGLRADQVLKPGVLPSTLTMLHLSHLDDENPGRIEAGALPESLTVLKMIGTPQGGQYPLTRDMFPSHLTHLELHFSKLIRCGPGILPDSLTHLIIREQEPVFEVGFFPPNLIYLQVTEEENEGCDLIPGVFPDSLRYLQLYTGNPTPIARDVLPSGLVYLDMADGFDGEIEPNALPGSLARLSFHAKPWSLSLTHQDWRLPFLPNHPITQLVLGHIFDQFIPVGMLPLTITHLAFGNPSDRQETAHDEPFAIGALPPRLVDLQLSDLYNQRILPGVLPSSLTHLKFGDVYKQPLAAGSLPNNLQSLTFGYGYNLPLGNLLHNLSSLTYLTFGARYNQELPRGFLPTNLTHLTFGNKFDQFIGDGVLPQSLTHLTFGKSYNQLLAPGVLPRGLTHLSLGTDYEFAFVAGVLPDGLTHLRTGPEYVRIVQDISVIPRTVTHLMIGNDTREHYDAYRLEAYCDFPPWITHLTFGTNIRPQIPYHPLSEGLTHFSMLRDGAGGVIDSYIPTSTTHIEINDDPDRIEISDNNMITHLTLRAPIPWEEVRWPALYHVTIRSEPRGGIDVQHVRLQNLNQRITHLRVSWTDELLVELSFKPSFQHLEIYEYDDWKMKVFWPVPIPLTDSAFNENLHDGEGGGTKNRPFFTERDFFTELYDSTLQTISFFEHYDSTTAMTTHIVRRDHQRHIAYLDPPIPTIPQPHAQEWKNDEDDDEQKMDTTGVLGRIRSRVEDQDQEEDDDEQKIDESQPSSTRRRLNSVEEDQKVDNDDDDRSSRIYYNYHRHHHTQNGQPYYDVIPIGTQVWLTDTISVDPYAVIWSERHNAYTLRRSITRQDLVDLRRVGHTFAKGFIIEDEETSNIWLLHHLELPASIENGSSLYTCVTFCLYGEVSRPCQQELQLPVQYSIRIESDRYGKEWASYAILRHGSTTLTHLLSPMRQGYGNGYRVVVNDSMDSFDGFLPVKFGSNNQSYTRESVHTLYQIVYTVRPDSYEENVYSPPPTEAQRLIDFFTMDMIQMNKLFYNARLMQSLGVLQRHPWLGGSTFHPATLNRLLESPSSSMASSWMGSSLGRALLMNKMKDVVLPFPRVDTAQYKIQLDLRLWDEEHQRYYDVLPYFHKVVTLIGGSYEEFVQNMMTLYDRLDIQGRRGSSWGFPSVFYIYVCPTGEHPELKELKADTPETRREKRLGLLEQFRPVYELFKQICQPPSTFEAEEMKEEEANALEPTAGGGGGDKKKRRHDSDWEEDSDQAIESDEEEEEEKEDRKKKHSDKKAKDKKQTREQKSTKPVRKGKQAKHTSRKESTTRDSDDSSSQKLKRVKNVRSIADIMLETKRSGNDKAKSKGENPTYDNSQIEYIFDFRDFKHYHLVNTEWKVVTVWDLLRLDDQAKRQLKVYFINKIGMLAKAPTGVKGRSIAPGYIEPFAEPTHDLGDGHMGIETQHVVLGYLAKEGVGNYPEKMWFNKDTNGVISTYVPSMREKSPHVYLRHDLSQLHPDNFYPAHSKVYLYGALVTLENQPDRVVDNDNDDRTLSALNSSSSNLSDTAMLLVSPEVLFAHAQNRSSPSRRVHDESKRNSPTVSIRGTPTFSNPPSPTPTMLAYEDRSSSSPSHNVPGGPNRMITLSSPTIRGTSMSPIPFTRNSVSSSTLASPAPPAFSRNDALYNAYEQASYNAYEQDYVDDNYNHNPSAPITYTYNDNTSESDRKEQSSLPNSPSIEHSVSNALLSLQRLHQSQPVGVRRNSGQLTVPSLATTPSPRRQHRSQALQAVPPMVVRPRPDSGASMRLIPSQEEESPERASPKRTPTPTNLHMDRTGGGGSGTTTKKTKTKKKDEAKEQMRIHHEAQRAAQREHLKQWKLKYYSAEETNKRKIEAERIDSIVRPKAEEEKRMRTSFEEALSSNDLSRAFQLWRDNPDHYIPSYDRYFEWFQPYLTKNVRYFLQHFSSLQSKASFPQLYQLIDDKKTSTSVKALLQTRMNELYPDLVKSMEYSKQLSATQQRYIDQWLSDDYHRVVRDRDAIYHINEAVLAAPRSTKEFFVFRGSDSRASKQDAIKLPMYNHYKFFGGTSLSLEVALSIGHQTYVIRVPTGTPFLYYPNNHFDEEYEVLLPPNWHFTEWIPTDDIFHTHAYGSGLVKPFLCVDFHYSVTNPEQESQWMYQEDTFKYGKPATDQRMKLKKEHKRDDDSDDSFVDDDDDNNES